MNPRMTDVVLPPTFETTARAGSGADEALPSAKVLTKHFLFLDNLRESGITNMFGATPYLQEIFGLKRGDATRVLSAWMRSFSEAPASERAVIAIAKAKAGAL